VERRVQRGALRRRGRRGGRHHGSERCGAEDEPRHGTTGSSVDSGVAFTSAEPSANGVLKRVSAVRGLPHLNARNAYSYCPGSSLAVGIVTVVSPTALPLALATGSPVFASRICSRYVHGRLHVNPVC